MKPVSGTLNINIFGRGTLQNKTLFLFGMGVLCGLYAFFSDYNLATGTGNLSMVLFLGANIYFPAKRIRLKYNMKNVQSEFNTLLIWHIWLNTTSFFVACIHCYISLWSNTWLIAALFMMGWLTFGGFLMWFRYQPGKVKKGMYLLHTQQIIFFLMIFAMLKGHYVI